MRRIIRHPLTQVCIGWLVFLAVWLVLPVDPPYADQPVVHRSST